MGLVAGVVGAVIGTFGGAEIRSRMAKAFGRDAPAAFIEDAGAIILGLVIVWACDEPALRRHRDRRRPGRAADGRPACGAGQKVALIERKLIGGTCVNTGCTPTKTLVASAYAAHLARRAADFGVTPGRRRRFRRRHGAQEHVVGNSRSSLEAWLRGMANCTLFEGQARFLSPTTIRVGDDVLEAERIFINVGGRASNARFSGSRSGEDADQHDAA